MLNGETIQASLQQHCDIKMRLAFFLAFSRKKMLSERNFIYLESNSQDTNVKIIKRNCEFLWKVLFKLFNESLEKGNFPIAWYYQVISFSK